MGRVYIGLILLGLLVLAVKGYSNEGSASAAGQAGCVVSGRVIYDGDAPVVVCLADEETFGSRMDGLEFLILDPDEGLRFTFDGLEPGIYCIRCFADENGNGELDGGAFGPKEPWGMSWQGESKRGIPKFRDISFLVNGETVVSVAVTD